MIVTDCSWAYFINELLPTWYASKIENEAKAIAG